MTMIDCFEWVGCITSLVGALLLAIHTSISRWGWVVFFAANLAMLAFAFGIERHGLFLQQIGFTGTSLLGIYRAGFLDRFFPRS